MSFTERIAEFDRADAGIDFEENAHHPSDRELQHAPPTYLSLWDSEFEESHFEPTALRFMSATVFLFGSISFVLDVMDPNDRDIGGVGWTWLTYSGELAAAVMSFVVCAMLSTARLRGICVRRYQVLCVSWLLGVTAGWMMMMFLIEHRRHSLDHSQLLYHLSLIHI